MNKITTFSLFALSVLLLSGCGASNLGTNLNGNNLNQRTQDQKRDMTGDQLQTKTRDQQQKMDQARELEGEMKFKNPGNDEVGQRLREMDQLMNQTTPADYQEEYLSDETLEAE